MLQQQTTGMLQIVFPSKGASHVISKIPIDFRVKCLDHVIIDVVMMMSFSRKEVFPIHYRCRRGVTPDVGVQIEECFVI